MPVPSFDPAEVATHIALLDEATELLAAAERPFQVFVRTVGGRTITLNNITSRTTINTLLQTIEDREGIAVRSQRLVYAAKELRADMTVGNYGISAEATLTSLMRLPGGVGELTAVQSTLDRGFRRGNVTQSIIASQGESQVMLSFGRVLNGYYREPSEAAYPDPEEFRKAQSRFEEKVELTTQFQDCVRQTVEQTLNSKFANDQEWSGWWARKQMFVEGLVSEATMAANCGEFSLLVFNHLLENTKNQWVYRLSMDGTPTGKKYDHALCCTYPTEHEGRTVGGMDLTVATIADGWDNYLVISVQQFLAGNNAYGEELIPENLAITDRAECTGTPGLDDNLRDALRGMIQGQVDTFAQSEVFQSQCEAAQAVAVEKQEHLGGRREEDPAPYQFNLPFADAVRDKRTTEELVKKVYKAQEIGFDVALAELQDLTDSQFLDVFLIAPEWAVVLPLSEKMRMKTFEALLADGGTRLNRFANLLDDNVLWEFFEWTPAAAQLVLNTPGIAQTRIFRKLQMDTVRFQAVCNRMTTQQSQFLDAYLDNE